MRTTKQGISIATPHFKQSKQQPTFSNAIDAYGWLLVGYVYSTSYIYSRW